MSCCKLCGTDIENTYKCYYCGYLNSEVFDEELEQNKINDRRKLLIEKIEDVSVTYYTYIWSGGTFKLHEQKKTGFGSGEKLYEKYSQPKNAVFSYSSDMDAPVPVSVRIGGKLKKLSVTLPGNKSGSFKLGIKLGSDMRLRIRFGSSESAPVDLPGLATL